MKIDIVKTLIKSVGENTDFHFYIDELADNDAMPTYQGRADEKYSFDEMDGEFFDFVEKKAAEGGIFIRLILASSKSTDESTVISMEHGMDVTDIKAMSGDVFDFLDYGIKVRGSFVSFGAGIMECDVAHFAEFGCRELPADDPVNVRACDIMKNFVVCEV